MPPGARKRKAAKKKKEKETHNKSSPPNDNSNHAHRTDEAKSQDERDSDGGETVSPVSQEQHPLKDENNDVERRESSSVQSLDNENKSVQAAPPQGSLEGGHKDESAVEIIKVAKSEEGSEGTNIPIEHHEISKELHDGGPKEKTNDPILKTATVDDSVNSVDSLSKEVVSVTEESPVVEVNEPESKNSHIIDSAKQVEIHVSQVASVENSAISSTVDRSLEQHGENMLPKLNEITGVSSIGVNPAATKTGDKVSTSAGEAVQESTTTMVSVSAGTKAELSTDNPETKDNGVSRVTDVPGRSEKQPLIASAPRAVPKTSWLSCCGLLDVITGTDR